MPRSFWDLNEAHKCVLEGDSLVNKMRKPELARALSALAWFVRTIPNAPELLLEVRALAGQVTDGLDKPGTDEYVDHPWRALMGQKGLTPFSYTTAIKQAGVPQAPPPLPGHVPAWSYVLDPGAGRPVGGAGADDDAGREAVPAGAEGDLNTRTVSQEAPQQREEEEEDIFSNLGTLSGGGGGGDDDDGGGQVSAPVAHDDHVRVGVVDETVLATGNVRAPAATDPLVDAGSTLGRDGAGQSQVQAGAQVQGPADNNKRRLCKSVWRDDVCRDSACARAHPPRCGDPRCYPTRRQGCQHWHRMGGTQKQSSRGPSQRQQHQQHRPQLQQLQQQQQRQGNGLRAVPGRAGRQQAQGKQDGQLRQVPRRQRQQQQQQQQQWQQQQQQQQQQQGQGRQLQQRQFPSFQLQPQPRQQQQGQGWQLQQRQVPSYRDVAALGTSHSHSTPLGAGGGGSPVNVGFAPVLPDRDVLSTVVATVMAVLAGGRQHF